MDTTCTVAGCSVRTGHRCTMPAAAEGELRELARIFRRNGDDDSADALESIVNRYSGIKPMRDGHPLKCAEVHGNGCHRSHGHSGECCDQYGERLAAVCQVNASVSR